MRPVGWLDLGGNKPAGTNDASAELAPAVLKLISLKLKPPRPRTDQTGHCGFLLSMNACTPTCATGCIMLQAMVCPAS